MIELDDIRTLVEVVRAGSFATAARQLGVAKSIISRRIARLEQDLGTTLLSRTTRGVSPTEAGMEFCEQGRDILLKLDEARDAMTTRRGEIVGRLRVSVPLSFGIRHMGPFLAKLLMTYARLEIDLAYTDRSVDLLAGGFDLAVRTGTLRDSTLIARHVAPINLVVVASPTYVKQHGAPKIPKDLEKHACLVYTGSRERQPWHFWKGKQCTTFLPEGRFFADNGEGLIQAAEAGLGIAALPDFIVDVSLKNGSLVRLLSGFEMQEGALYVVRPPGATVSAKTRVFIETFVSFFGTKAS